MPNDTPNRDSLISLREVTKETLSDIASLNVAPHQHEYVASNVYSIAQAYFHREAWFRAIYAGETPVGFVMLEDWSQIDNSRDTPIFLWRFMIDHRYQGLSFGRKALKAIVDHIRSKSDQVSLAASYMPGPHSPEGFYRRLGFEPTGELMGGEIVIKLPFDTI
jgi:diamine N-acetyltransferase